MIKLACGGMGGTRKAQDNTGSYGCRIRCIPIQGMLQGACWRFRHGSQRATYTLGNDTVHPRMENYRRDEGLFLIRFLNFFPYE